MKAIVFDRFGDPAEVLQVRDVPQPVPGPGEVRVRMIACPINPSDLFMIRGQYGMLPPLPATPGFEGVGIVEEAGSGILGRFRVGKRVAVLNGKSGNWQEQVVVPARQVVPVSDQIDDEEAASFFVNPATAYVLTRWILRVPRDGWLLQTAANGALGRMIVRLSIWCGFKTINVVRRREQGEQLRDLGGAPFICTADESIEERVQQITGGAGVKYAIDAVGGATGSAAARALAPGGRLVVYSTLSGEPLTVDPRWLMTGGRSIEGFWLSHWTKSQSSLTMLRLFRTINRYMAEGTLKSEVGATFALDDIRKALAQVNVPGRFGKVVLRIAPKKEGTAD